MKTIPLLEDLLFGLEILFCPRGIINKPTVRRAPYETTLQTLIFANDTV
jgi:hypothetical protein